MVILEKLRDAILATGRIKYIKETGYMCLDCPMCKARGHQNQDTKGRAAFLFIENGFRFNCFKCFPPSTYRTGGKLWDDLKEVLEMINIPLSEVTIDENELSLQERAKLRKQSVALEIKEKPIESIIEGWQGFDHTQVRRGKKNQLMSSYNMRPLDENTPREIVEYMVARGFRPEYYDFYYQPEYDDSRDDLNKVFQTTQRLIMPYFYQGKIVGEVGRHVSLPENTSFPPKYIKINPDDMLFGVDNIASSDRDLIPLCEGAPDAIACNGVASISAISPLFINITKHFAKKHGKLVVMVTDNDKRGFEAIPHAIKAGIMVSYPSWIQNNTHKDAGEVLATGVLREDIIADIEENAMSGDGAIKYLADKYNKDHDIGANIKW